MATVLITGGTGFVGSHLIPRLAERHQVVALARTLPAGPAPDARWIRQDLVRPLDVKQLPQRLDAVIHLAQSYRFKDFPDGARDVFEVNVHSTLNLLEYARQACATSFIYASSGGVYGYSYERFAESDRVNPLNFYISSKYCAELLIANYRQFFNTVIFRFFFVYGPGQKGMLVPNLMDTLRRGDTVSIEGDPGIRLNPVYVDDAVSAFEPAMNLEGPELFNVAGDQAVTLTELVRVMARVTGAEPSIRYSDARHQGDLVGDNTRMKQVLGVTPRVTLIDGLTRVARALDA